MPHGNVAEECDGPVGFCHREVPRQPEQYSFSSVCKDSHFRQNTKRACLNWIICKYASTSFFVNMQSRPQKLL